VRPSDSIGSEWRPRVQSSATADASMVNLSDPLDTLWVAMRPLFGLIARSISFFKNLRVFETSRDLIKFSEVIELAKGLNVIDGRAATDY
jgi:hypothetical protein